MTSASSAKRNASCTATNPKETQMKNNVKKAPAKKSTSTAKSSRWSIGLFRNASGKLATVYVTADGVPMPYEKERVKGGKILFHAVYVGVRYAQARAQLVKESGLKDQVVAATNGKAKNEKAVASKK